MLLQRQIFKQLTAGLCVLVLLLLAGISASPSVSPSHSQSRNLHPAITAMAAANLVADTRGGAPCSSHDHEHGLTCCGNATCATGLAILSTASSLFSRQPRPTYMMLSQLMPDDAARAPGFHPPRIPA